MFFCLDSPSIGTGPGAAHATTCAPARLPAGPTYRRDDPTAVKSCKQLVAASLDCDQLPAKSLGSAWLPAPRRWSALAQASRGAPGF
jgi:hypothetical protein